MEVARRASAKKATSKGSKRPSDRHSGAEGGQHAKRVKLQGDLTKKANSLKLLYQRTDSVLHHLLGCIQGDENYGWANNPKIKERLQQARDEVEGRVGQHAFNRFYLLNDMAVVRSTYGEEAEGLLQSFCQGVEGALGNFDRELSRLNRMHAANVAT